jgi:CheY-like chemotaxis protein/nitrogen-specific signal transduction histidine kinase
MIVAERTAAYLEAKEAAEQASRSKSQFLANMSHELRTPMNAIMGMTEIVRRQLRDPEQAKRLAKVKQASIHLLNVINDILDLSKIEAGRLTLEHVDFDLSEVFDNLVTIAGQKAQEKGLELRICVAPELKGLSVCGDPLRLGQVLLNLVGNSVKFTETGHVTVRATRVECDGPGVGLHIEVQDTGIGIPDAYRTRIFSAFEQANDSMARQYGGTGLGLAISKHLVELMSGKIGVTSAPGAGSTFWFDICLATSSGERALPGQQTPHTAEGMIRGKHGGRRVLLVEDEPTNQEVARMLLAEAGLLVDLASDGAQAVDMARAAPYALVLMDMQMPVMSGVDATRAIRADSANENTPIVAMTANAFEEDRNACIEAGMDDHIGKPVDADRLYTVLLTQLDMGRT